MALENLRSVFRVTDETDFQTKPLGVDNFSGDNQTQGIKDTRISFGVGFPYPISDLRFKVGLAKLGNRASIYYLGSGAENYENWGGITKAGDTVAVTGELSNFGPIEDFINTRLGIPVPEYEEDIKNLA